MTSTSRSVPGQCVALLLPGWTPRPLSSPICPGPGTKSHCPPLQIGSVTESSQPCCTGAGTQRSGCSSWETLVDLRERGVWGQLSGPGQQRQHAVGMHPVVSKVGQSGLCVGSTMRDTEGASWGLTATPWIKQDFIIPVHGSRGSGS